MHAYLHLSFHYAGKGSTVVTAAMSGFCCRCGYRDIVSVRSSSNHPPVVTSFPWFLFSIISCAAFVGHGVDAGDDCGVVISVVSHGKQ